MQTTQKNFYKKLFGGIGEKKSAKFLKKKGYKILEKNYKTKIGEIDIIAEKDGVIVFVEVKTRTDDSFGYAAEAVDRRKREKYFKVATEYLLKKQKIDSACRFDIIAIENDEINHIENAFCK